MMLQSIKTGEDSQGPISTLFAGIALYPYFRPSNCTVQPCWQRAEPGSPGESKQTRGETWKNHPY